MERTQSQNTDELLGQTQKSRENQHRFSKIKFITGIQYEDGSREYLDNQSCRFFIILIFIIIVQRLYISGLSIGISSTNNEYDELMKVNGMKREFVFKCTGLHLRNSTGWNTTEWIIFNTIFYRWMETKDVEEMVLDRIGEYRSQIQQESFSYLFPRLPTSRWGEANEFNKKSLYRLMTGELEKDDPKGMGKDRKKMEKFLDKTVYEDVPVPENRDISDFILTGAPLVDLLKVDSERVDSWSKPSLKYLKYIQDNRGLGYSMYKANQEEFPTGVMSMDVEELKITYYDYLRLAGMLEPETDVVLLNPQKSPKMEVTSRDGKFVDVEDDWFQLPVRIMLGDADTWSL